MSTGLPILTTRTRGALDVVGQDCSAQWANANDPADLAQSLRQFVCRLGQQQHYPQLAQYQPQEAFRQVMAFYEAVLAGSSPHVPNPATARAMQETMRSENLMRAESMEELKIQLNVM
jgi:hypothetical protein